MHVPGAFRPRGQDEVFAAIEAYPFATVVSTRLAAVPAVTHLPLLLDRDRGPHGVLVGHLARANPHSDLLGAGAATVAVFHGPSGYVSPSWYRQEPSLPTWNYLAVHAEGTPSLVDDPGHLRALLTRTVDHFESRDGDGEPWALDAGSDYVAGYLGAIVAFELPIEALKASFKLSQNIEEPLRSRVVEGLRRRGGAGDRGLADAMVAHPPPGPSP